MKPDRWNSPAAKAQRWLDYLAWRAWRDAQDANPPRMR